MSEEDIPMDKLARVYRKINAKMQEITAQYDTEIAALKEQRDALGTAIKDRMLALGVTSVKTDDGTVILSTKTRYFTNDWAAFNAFVIEHNVPDLLEKRIAQGNMATFLQENPKLYPPGLNSNTEFQVSVRKPTVK